MTRRTTIVVLVLGVVAALTPGAAAASGHEAVERIFGPDRFATAAAVAAVTHPDGAGTVFVATGQDFADALATGPAASAADAPLLLTLRESVPDATAAALADLDPDEVVLVGGSAAISEAVAGEIGDLTGAQVRRVSGPTRYDTAAAVAGEFEPGVPVVYVANGTLFPDAVAGGAAGATTGGPVLLTLPDALPPATRDALERLQPGRIAVLGGTAVVSQGVESALAAFTDGEVDRLFGRERIETAVAISQDTFEDADTVYLATSGNFPDALAGAVIAGRDAAPILLSTRGCLPPIVRDELDRLQPDTVRLLGGGRALGGGVEHLLVCGEPEVTVIATGLQAPWDVAFTPDGRVFVTERDTANIVEIVDGQRVVRQTIAGVSAPSEAGLLGLTVSPTYDEDGLLYAYHTTASDNRVVRFRLGEAPQPVLTGIPRASNHNGGRIAFGPDGMLYVTTGDAATPALSQTTASLAGKILRITPEGQPAPGNPFGNSPVYAYGLRNVQGLGWAESGRLYATEFGPGCDDEINHIVAGGNYGWPDPCGTTRAGAIAPLIVRQPPVASWSGMEVQVAGAIPEWEGSIFAAALRGTRLWRFSLTPGGQVSGAEELLVGQFGRLRHVTQAPDGSLWVLTSNRDGRGNPVAADDRIIRIGPRQE